MKKNFGRRSFWGKNPVLTNDVFDQLLTTFGPWDLLRGHEVDRHLQALGSPAATLQVVLLGPVGCEITQSLEARRVRTWKLRVVTCGNRHLGRVSHLKNSLPVSIIMLHTSLDAEICSKSDEIVKAWSTLVVKLVHESRARWDRFIRFKGNYIIKRRQEERWTINDKVQVRIKRSADSMHELPSPSKRQCSNQIDNEKGDTLSGPTSKLTSKLLSAHVLEQWEQECVRIRSKLKQMKVARDDSSFYGKGSIEGKHAAYNCLANFMITHILESKRHEKNYIAFRGLGKDLMHRVLVDEEQDHRKEIEASIETLRSLMETNEGWDFEVIAVTSHDFKDKSFVSMRLGNHLKLSHATIARVYLSFMILG
ncbi:hypothetical protein GOP47_0006022 [Adiantum capillus-veneris]|uniref:Uncharacterized protein n=1 Tax=Adiantum capillus-veneris TaxID=13818 RepID=A0A9D4V2T0_ADICA|nr:hypothetical protein GOP47_0006022 [Adiantum capillus-veneris]